MNKLKLTLGVPMVAWALISCASKPKTVEFAADANPSVEIQNQEQALTDAKTRHVHLLSPDHFARAEKTLKKAKGDLQDKDDAKDILENVGLSKAYLGQAESVATRAGKQIPSVLEARQHALDAKAGSLMPKQLENIDEDLADLGEDFESAKGETTAIKATDVTDLQERYAKIEESSIKTDRLGAVYSVMENVESNKGARVCPRTLEQTKIRLSAAEKAIETRRSDVSAVDTAVITARDQAQKLQFVCDQALKSGGREAEPLALSLYEQRLASGELKTNLAAARNQVTDARGQAQQAQAMATQAQNENSKLADKAQREEALKSRIEALRSEFKNDEAEIVQKGEDVILRLRKIQFSSSRSDIPAQAIPTLNKVRAVITDLGAQKVVVEGHTDSVGSAEVNMKVSQQRSEIVKDFLAGDRSIKADIEAVGRGFEEPLTTNKTKAGRAQNRRVDVVITPSASL